MKLNKLGNELYKKWENNYVLTNDQLGGNSANGDYVEGWCIIENTKWIKTIEDACGVYIYGYDDAALDTIAEWIEDSSKDDLLGFQLGITLEQFYEELKKYFE